MTHQTNPKPLFSAQSISSIIEAMLTEDNHQFTESTTDGVVTYQVHGKYYDNGIVYIHASDSQKLKYYVGSTVNAKRANSTNEGGRGKRYDEQSMSVQYIIQACQPRIMQMT
ncbi:hypothetical protein JCM19233_3552 [Vibrio astriarenae]|nr:hypothetical protein JCM19233_3552 [Vibrio sp. C7]